ncbi:putative protein MICRORCHIDIA 7 [Iris pallida]|uniref:Uncharacterized protein n=1 Tax=Iris pallida TaxID=29817 RepID=A0AAX6EW76_IRIPA|nr:putative protein MICRORCHIDIA 7 [Iris pallida]
MVVEEGARKAEGDDLPLGFLDPLPSQEEAIPAASAAPVVRAAVAGGQAVLEGRGLRSGPGCRSFAVYCRSGHGSREGTPQVSSFKCH